MTCRPANLNYDPNLNPAEVVVLATSRLTRRSRRESLPRLFLGEAQTHRLLAGETVITDTDVLRLETQ